MPLFFVGELINKRAKKEYTEEIEQYYKNIRGSVKSYLSTQKIYNETDSTINLKQIPFSNEKDLNKNNILELMLANMKEIKEYYVLSKSQAKKAFTGALFMGVLGFVLIGVSIMIAIFINNNIAATLIPAVGAVVVDLLSATFLVVYKKSLQQLNHYYSELHDNEKFLSAVNLVDYISDEKQDGVYIEIIRSRLNSDIN